MNFDFSAEQYAFRDSLKTLLEECFDPSMAIAAGADPAAVDGVWGRLAELGLFSVLVPESHDGLGLGFVDAALLVETMGAALVPPAVFDTLLVTDLVSRHGTQAQKSRLLPQLATGRLRASIAAAEQFGFGAVAMRTRASNTGNIWTLDGSKILVPEADRADLLLVAATTADGVPGLFLLEQDPVSYSCRQHETLDLTARYHAVDFRSVALHDDALLGGSIGSEPVARLFDGAATIAALHLTGIAGWMFDTAVAYARTREQFGKPIGSFQAIKHRCADMAVQLDVGRTAAYYAAWALAEGGEEQPRAASIAKSFCGDAARFICNESIQVHGGMGFTWELGLHYPLRRAKVLEYAWGDAVFHRERLIAGIAGQTVHPSPAEDAG
jgi:alkylation response protein AidB-like acyl-CoA dehydrogenase